MIVKAPLPEDDDDQPENKRPATKTNSEKPLTLKAPNRWRQMNTFVDEYMSEVPNRSVMLLVFMFRHANPNGYVQIDQKFAAKKIGYSDRNLRTALAWLKDNGFLETIHQGGLNRGPSRYRLRFPP